LFLLAKTYAGQDIIGVSISKNSSSPATPLLFFHCGMHPREWIAPTTCLWIIDQLLNIDPDRQQLLESFNFILVPVLNIDGYDYTHTTARLWRKNREPNTGSTCIGTDLNRNYPFQWGGTGSSSNPCSEIFRGKAAGSSPETESELEFLAPYIAEKRLAAYIDIHAYGGWFLSPWGYTNAIPPDYPEMDEMMVTAVKAMYSINSRNYVYGSAGKTLYPTSGDTTDEMYGQNGVVHSYTIECWGSSFTPSPAQIAPVGKEVWAGVKALAFKLANKQ